MSTTLRNRMRTAGLAWALVGGAMACNGPIGLAAGGRLEGAETPAPASWSGLEDTGTAQLETRPADPYSVNLAYTIVDGVLYLNAGDTETNWVQHMEADPQVRLRIDDRLYALRAERVTDAAEVDAFAEAWTGQSFFRRDPRELDQAWIYRLVSR